MKETLKTLLLVILVGTSLLQTYLLAYSEPKFDTVIPTDYVESELEGTQSELGDMLFPKDIVLHNGNEFTVLYPEMIFYSMIMEIVQQRSFDGLRNASGTLDEAGRISEETEGIEIRFAQPLSLQLLQQMMNLQGIGIVDAQPIDRIYIYKRSDREDVRVYFADSRNGAVYEATRADLTVKDVERFVGFGESRVKYVMAAKDLYLPMAPIPMVEYRYAYRQFTADQLQRSLFPDPFSTRNLTERDGSEIYTDGKRSLQLSLGQRWMRYTDPAASAEGQYSTLDTALSAVQFVNRHGGWNGEYMLESVEHDAANHEQQIHFRQYVGSYLGSFPVIGTSDGLPFGSIEMVLRNRAVTGYERSTVQLDDMVVTRKSVQLPGGESLEMLWESYPNRAQVLSIYPAYRAVLTEDEVLLTPVWALTKRDGSIHVLPGGGAF